MLSWVSTSRGTRYLWLITHFALIFNGHHEHVDRYGVSMCTMKTDLFSFPLSTWLFMSNLAGVSRRAEGAYLPAHLVHAPSI